MADAGVGFALCKELLHLVGMAESECNVLSLPAAANSFNNLNGKQLVLHFGRYVDLLSKSKIKSAFSHCHSSPLHIHCLLISLIRDDCFCVFFLTHYSNFKTATQIALYSRFCQPQLTKAILQYHFLFTFLSNY